MTDWCWCTVHVAPDGHESLGSASTDQKLIGHFEEPSSIADGDLIPIRCYSNTAVEGSGEEIITCEVEAGYHDPQDNYKWVPDSSMGQSKPYAVEDKAQGTIKVRHSSLFLGGRQQFSGNLSLPELSGIALAVPRMGS